MSLRIIQHFWRTNSLGRFFLYFVRSLSEKTPTWVEYIQKQFAIYLNVFVHHLHFGCGKNNIIQCNLLDDQISH